MPSITEIMSKEHAKIDSILIDFENTISTSKDEARYILSKLQWSIDKHFFVEEKVIFRVYNSLNEKESEDILELLKQHKDILWILKSIQNSLKSNLKIQIKEFKQILSIHTKLENNIFYPKLDKDLDENNKQLILDRIEDVVI